MARAQWLVATLLASLGSLGCGGPGTRSSPPSAASTDAPPAMVSAYERGLVTALPADGRVAVWTTTGLAPTPAAARAGDDRFATVVPALHSARLLEVHDGVAALETVGDRDDCIADHDLGYRLRVYVPLTALVPRLTGPQRQAYPDGTGWARPVGAPVAAYADGALRPLDWPALGTVRPSEVALAVTPSREAALAPLDAAEAECPPPGQPPPRAHDEPDLMGSDTGGPPCQLDHSRARVITVGGDAIASPAELSAPAVSHTYALWKRGDTGAYLVVIHRPCAVVRAAVPADHVGVLDDLGGAGLGGGRPAYVAVKAGAAVTWPDGSPAGVADGTDAIVEAAVEREHERACFPVRHLTERLCARAADLVPTEPPLHLR